MKEKINDINGSEWRGLYIGGGIASLIVPLLYCIAGLVNALVYNSGQFPGKVTEWFDLFNSNWFYGIFLLGFTDVLIMLCTIPMFLALFVCLWKDARSLTTISVAFAFIGIAGYLATNTSFVMLSLSHQYLAAVSESQRALIVSSGHTIIADTRAAIGIGLMFFSCSLISIVITQNKYFGKVIGIAGILGFLLFILSMPFASYTSGSTDALGTAIIGITYAGGGLLTTAWYVLVGLKLIKLGRTRSSISR